MYVAIDANIELAEEENTFDVFGYLKMLRQSRRGLIEDVVMALIKFDQRKSLVNKKFLNL